MGVDLVTAKPGSLRDRLVEAADAELTLHGTLTGRFEAVARRAGVSRATAYRQLGSVSELVRQVGLRRSEKYRAQVTEVMDAEVGALAKLEAAMIYCARVLPDDPIVLDLISREFSFALDPEVYGLVKDLMGPALVEGRRSGEIRSDVALDALLRHLVEQSYLAAQMPDRSAEAVRQRFRTFVEPCIVPVRTT